MTELLKFFNAIKEEISSLLFKKDTTKEDWQRIKELQALRDNKMQELRAETKDVRDNDIQQDYVHDAILAHDEKNIQEVPTGYKIITLASYYVTGYRTYYTFAYVEKPNGEFYYMLMNSVTRAKAGETFQG